MTASAHKTKGTKTGSAETRRSGDGNVPAGTGGKSTLRDFTADAFAHMKFIGYTDEAMPLLKKAGIADRLDEACINPPKATDAKAFIIACGMLRFRQREKAVNAV